MADEQWSDDVEADLGEERAGEETPAPALTPPPLRQRGSLTDWKGRTPFEELFVPDASPLPSSRGGLEEKVEFFREKLKRVESQVTRFREAWGVREGELDTLEALIKTQKGHGQTLNKALSEKNRANEL